VEEKLEMNKKMRLLLVPVFFVLFVFNTYSQKIDPTSVLWYTHPADKWENALPVGNGRLGAMVFGRTEEEKIQFNEETYWSGGPYCQTRKGGAEVLPEIQKLIFEGQYIKAHKLFGQFMMGYPVEQMKYQSFGDLILKFPEKGEVKEYFHSLDLDKAIVITSYRQNGIKYKREVFVSPVDEVIVIRITADKPGSISFTANLRGYRNQAHSNYATDYFHMDGYGDDGLILQGKSADYLGVEGKLRFQGRLKALSEGGTIRVDETDLKISGADHVTLYIAAATNFVDYRDVSANPDKRVKAVLRAIEGREFDEVKTAHIKEHQRLFRRVYADFGSSPDSFLPTDERLAKFTGENDPALAALCLQFGRYLLISSSRAGTQPANLQGIWNQDMNPSWDSKYTTNINTEMNYWPAEVGNLSECTEPLIKMIKELTVKGSDVAREHYGAEGWVFHQNTDLWRVAAPMDGPDWGAFTTGGAWLCTHLWEHYLFCRGNDRFFDEVCAWMSPGTTICAGSTIDMQILRDLFLYVAEAADILGIDQEFCQKVLSTRKKLAPMQIGQKGDIQEWLEDWGQKEKSHRHISNLYGLFPGNQISARTTPELAEGCRIVLEQRGLVGNGWASAWKMACWARLFNGAKAMDNLNYYIHNYVFDNLFAICSKSLQVDGSFGVSAAVAEMILQSHEDEIFFLPALPKFWKNGEVRGLCARGGFEVDIKWEKTCLISALILSRKGNKCRLRTSHAVDVYNNGDKIKVKRYDKNLIEFDTKKDEFYRIAIFIQGAEL
jgi:alpha-L-fucosidase 2